MNTIDEDFVECDKCGMMLKRTKCKTSKTAHVKVSDQEGKVHVLILFNYVLASVIGEVTDVRCALLSTDTLKFNVKCTKSLF